MVAAVTLLLVLSQAPAEQTPASNVVRSRAWIPAVVGGVLMLGGAAAVTVGALQTRSAATLMGDEQAARLDTARYNTVGGVALLGMGACIAGLSAVMFFWTPSPDVTVSFAPTSQGGLFVLGARW